MREGEKGAINFVACMNWCMESKIRGVFPFLGILTINGFKSR
jgi:hypothetical protein